MWRMAKVFTVCTLLLLLVSCEKPIYELAYEDYGIIVDKYYRAMWLQPVITGKTTTFINHPEISKICIEYKGNRIWIEDDNVYDEYKDKINEEVKINVIEREYKGGKVKYNIESIIQK